MSRNRGRGYHTVQNFPQQHRKILGKDTYRILIRESKVKVVLGPEGRHIREIRDKCAENIKITIYTQHAGGEPFPPNCPDRILSIDCSLDDLETIMISLIPHVQIAPPDSMRGKYNEIRLVVPDFVCSRIIGQGGENVKGIQKEFNSFVQVHIESLPYSSENVVSVTNRDNISLAASVKRIYDTIYDIKEISHVTLYNPVIWYPGEFGDTGSFTEESHVRPHYSRNHHEQRFYREHPRFIDNAHNHPDYESNSTHRSPGHMPTHASTRGTPSWRPHRGGRKQNFTRGTFHHNRSLDNDASNNTLPRRPHVTRGRAMNNGNQGQEN